MWTLDLISTYFLLCKVAAPASASARDLVTVQMTVTGASQLSILTTMGPLVSQEHSPLGPRRVIVD